MFNGNMPNILKEHAKKYEGIYITSTIEATWIKQASHPQSKNGRGGYPPSGGGFNDGGRLPQEFPMLSLTTLPVYRDEDKQTVGIKNK